MSKSPPPPSVSAAITRFVATVLAKTPLRVEAKVASRNGMALLCEVEAVLDTALPRHATQELVWLGGAPKPGVHVLQLQAFGPDNALLAEAMHEFPA